LVSAADPEVLSAGGSFAAFVEWMVAPTIAFVTVGLLAADQGGYFPAAWGWGALIGLLPLAVWLILGLENEPGRLGGLMVAAFSIVEAWTALSITWSDSAPRTVTETERILVYVACLAAILFTARRAGLRRLAAAVFLAIVLIDVYSLCTRLFPDRLGVFDPIAVYRLSEPVGYWNGLGILTVIGILIGVGLAARGEGVPGRLASAAALTILLPTLYFTFSRGAWIALAVGLVCAVAYDSRRLHLVSWLLFLAPAPAFATLLAWRSDALTHTEVPLPNAVHDGHRLALALALLLPAAACCAGTAIFAERRIRLSRVAALGVAGALVGVVVLAISLGVAHYGGPGKTWTRAYNSFNSPLPPTESNLNSRLRSLSSNGRIVLWRVAWDDYKAHAALGSGAGTFSRYWFRGRPGPGAARDAHGLYIETLAELGPVGLAALIGALSIPLLAARRARKEPLASCLLGAYLALVIHAGVDWDFELPGVSLAGLICGAALVIAARSDLGPRRMGGALRAGGVAVAILLTGFALWGLLGNSALAASEDARHAGNWNEAERQARRASRLIPWSPDPWVALGFSQTARGDLRAAGVSFRHAVAKDPGDWALWFRLAAVTTGKERRIVLAQVRRLNPLSPEVERLISPSG
jgi:hypothetical protein